MTTLKQLVKNLRAVFVRGQLDLAGAYPGGSKGDQMVIRISTSASLKFTKRKEKKNKREKKQ